MSESSTPQSVAPTGHADGSPVSGAVIPLPTGHRGQREPATADSRDNPVTGWLLELDALDPQEFSVLFAIHTLGSRRRSRRWIARGDLCRSTQLDQPGLTRILRGLERRGLLRIARHPVKPGWARYMLIVQ